MVAMLPNKRKGGQLHLEPILIVHKSGMSGMNEVPDYNSNGCFSSLFQEVVMDPWIDIVGPAFWEQPPCCTEERDI